MGRETFALRALRFSLYALFSRIVKDRMRAMKIKKDASEAGQPVLLGIESSGSACGVGISSGGRLSGEISANIRNIHSRQLAPFVEYLLQNTGTGGKELSAVVLSAGPGSFTGLRIGYSVAKGLAHALGIPIVEVPTLDVWAYQAGMQSLPVMPVIDAHRGEIFCACYQWEGEELKRSGEYALLKPPDLRGFLNSAALLTGADAAGLYPALEPFLPPGSRRLHPSPASPQLWALLELGLQKYRQNLASHPDSCEPLYLRAFKGAL